jgi:hypothetical protein
LEEISEKFMERTLDIVNQMYKNALKKLQDTKNKEHEKTQKQMNSERTSTNTKVKQWTLLKKKEICVLKMSTQNSKEELNKDMKNLRKKNQTDNL